MATDERLARAAESYRRAQADLDEARAELANEIRAAYHSGRRQADILRATGHVWTREYVRRVLDQERV